MKHLVISLLVVAVLAPLAIQAQERQPEPRPERAAGERAGGERRDGGERGLRDGGERRGGMMPGGLSFMDLRKWDTNGDMTIDDNEIEAATPKYVAELEETNKKVLKAFDKDGDGKLSDAEKAELEEMANLLRQAMTVRQLDQNGDGAFSAEEIEAGKGRLKEMVKRMNQFALDRMDTNKDGVISEDERKAAAERPRGEGERPRGEGERPRGDAPRRDGEGRTAAPVVPPPPPPVP